MSLLLSLNSLPAGTLFVIAVSDLGRQIQGQMADKWLCVFVCLECVFSSANLAVKVFLMALV